MKLYLKILGISIACSVITLLLFNRINNEDKIDYETKLISDSISEFSISNSAQRNLGKSSLPDLTFAASKTIDAVVHVKNTSIVEESDSWALQFFYGDDSKKR